MEESSSDPPAPSNPVIPPIMTMDTLPPGFVATGPPSPSVSGRPAQSVYGSSVGPAGIPLPPSVYGGTPSLRSDTEIPGGFPGGDPPPVVVPRQTSSKSSHSVSSRSAKDAPYTRSAARRRDDDDDSSVSSGLGSSDSLTTPPIRTRKLSSARAATPSYAAAPMPPGTNYPTTPRSSVSTNLGGTTRAARVPLPSSVSGSVVSGGAPSRAGSVVGGMRPPSDMGRPRSPLMGVRGLSSPEIIIPIPDPSPITVPVVIPA